MSDILPVALAALRLVAALTCGSWPYQPSVTARLMPLSAVLGIMVSMGPSWGGAGGMVLAQRVSSWMRRKRRRRLPARPSLLVVAQARSASASSSAPSALRLSK
ncbi:hypothetical protein [Streptomyces sp. T12]|uniref:hypothetical protein n=1 Tax=Streptomyces sp. T12 TaxID=477697 RepID=UPI0011A1D29C|nr:hypothetical protein [Streptomyces sp. T12]